MSEPKIRRRKCIVGVKELAEELGFSRFHVYAVIQGRRRPSPRLAAALEARGIKCRKPRPARERWE
jgi:hypothetical protein